MPSYVIVWQENLPRFSRKVRNREWTGHVALNIGNKFSHDKSDGKVNSNYVSWWPKKTGRSKIGDRLKSVRSSPDPKATMAHDIVGLKYLPDHVIELDTVGDDEQLMRDAWMVFMTNPRKYNIIWRNCATTVSRVIRAGGFFVRTRREPWTPTAAMSLATDIGGRRLLWEEFKKTLKKGGVDPNADYPDITEARSKAYCSTEAECAYQTEDGWQWNRQPPAAIK